MNERRREPRLDALKSARIYRKGDDACIETLGTSHAGIDCIVTCLSSLGAKIEFEAPPNLTDEIVVYFYLEDTGIPARVVWGAGRS